MSSLVNQRSPIWPLSDDTPAQPPQPPDTSTHDKIPSPLVESTWLGCQSSIGKL